MKPEVQQAELAKQHGRASADWVRLIEDPSTTVEIFHSPEGHHPAPHAAVYALSIVTPDSDRGFWLGTAESEDAARQLADDLGVKLVQPS